MSYYATSSLRKSAQAVCPEVFAVLAEASREVAAAHSRVADKERLSYNAGHVSTQKDSDANNDRWKEAAQAARQKADAERRAESSQAAQQEAEQSLRMTQLEVARLKVRGCYQTLLLSIIYWLRQQTDAGTRSTDRRLQPLTAKRCVHAAICTTCGSSSLPGAHRACSLNWPSLQFGWQSLPVTCTNMLIDGSEASS